MVIRILASAVMLCLSFSCIAADNEQECTYGPDFSGMLQPLKNKYAKARYTKDRTGVVIQLGDGDVIVSFSGCVDFGMEIALAATRKMPYTMKEAFARAVELVRQFDMVDPKKLEELLAQGKYEEIHTGVFYVTYPDLDELVIENGMEHGHATLRIRDSCCG